MTTPGRSPDLMSLKQTVGERLWLANELAIKQTVNTHVKKWIDELTAAANRGVTGIFWQRAATVPSWTTKHFAYFIEVVTAAPYNFTLKESKVNLTSGVYDCFEFAFHNGTVQLSIFDHGEDSCTAEYRGTYLASKFLDTVKSEVVTYMTTILAPLLLRISEGNKNKESTHYKESNWSGLHYKEFVRVISAEPYKYQVVEPEWSDASELTGYDIVFTTKPKNVKIIITKKSK